MPLGSWGDRLEEDSILVLQDGVRRHPSTLAVAAVCRHSEAMGTVLLGLASPGGSMQPGRMAMAHQLLVIIFVTADYLPNGSPASTVWP